MFVERRGVGLGGKEGIFFLYLPISIGIILNHDISGWWFEIFFGIFIRKIGEDEPISTSIFFKGVEITNKLRFERFIG